MRTLFVALVIMALARPAPSQSTSRDWRPTDRTVIGDFSRITSIATGMDRVYATSPTGLLIWHPQFRSWEGPFDPPNRSLLSGVFTALVDPLDQSLWLAKQDGWVHYQPELQLWDEAAVAEGIVTIAFDQGDPVAGLFIRSRQGWLLLPRGGLVPTPGRAPARPIAPATVDQALRGNPALQANAAQILLDPHLRTVRYTAVARSYDNLGWFVGTSGVGLLYLPDAAGIPERLRFGLPSLDVGALVSWPGGVWAATNRTAQADAALTFVAAELSDFRTLSGLPASGPPFTRTLELAGQGKAIWAATDYGVARVEPTDGRIELVDEGHGLPDSRVYSVVSRQGRIVVGTARGLARVNDSLQVERVAPGYAGTAYAVFPAGDTVWVGTPQGVLVALPGEQNLRRPSGLSSPRQQVPVFGLAPLGDTLVALTRDELLWKDPRTARWTQGPNLSAQLGRLRRFVADGPGLWVAGERGVGFARLGTAAVLMLREGDLPGTAGDLAVDRDYLWVATNEGLVRFRLDVIRP